ncbi:MAG: NAD(P)/FAD-dependent oxidoreductase [Bryobacteraceae bacterium]
MHHVVIVGGGFGGLYAAKALKDASLQITLVDRRNFHLFQPLLYQVATGGLSPGDIAAPLRWIFRREKNTRVLLGEVTAINVARKTITLEDNRGEISYDSLILATGATHTYFGHAEWERIAPGLKTIEDATTIRQRLLVAFEAAERETDPVRRQAWLTFVIVGAGPTGVELAGTLGEIANDTLRDNFRSIKPEQARILLVDGNDRVLSGYPPDLSRKAEHSLLQLSVRPRLGMHVVGIDEDGVTMQPSAGGPPERLASQTVLWAAGVAASPLGKMLTEGAGALTDRAGRVMVQPDLTVPGHPEILVIGDLAHVEYDGKMVPGVAPAAMQMGAYAAKVISSHVTGATPPPPFRYFDKGSLATIGRAAAVADFGKLRFGGVIAWMLWLFVHIMYLVGFENRLMVLLKWGISYTTYNRGARLITGQIEPLPEFKLVDPGGEKSTQSHTEIVHR